MNWYLKNQPKKSNNQIEFYRGDSKGFVYSSPFNYGIRFESDTTLFFFRMQYPSGDSPCMERVTCSYRLHSDTLFFTCMKTEYEMKLNKKRTRLIGGNSILKLFPCMY